MVSMSLLQSGYWQPLMHGEAKGFSLFICLLFTRYFLLYVLLCFLLYFFLKPPSKAPTAGLAGVIPTFFSSGFATSEVEAIGALGS